MIAMIVIIFVILILLVPIRIKTQYGESERENLKIQNKVKIYILYFLKIKTINLKDKKKIENQKGDYKENAIYKLLDMYINYYKMQKQLIKKEEITNLLKKIYYEKMYIEFKINLQNPIVNAYIITFINVIINIFIMISQERMDLKNVHYSTSVSDNIFNLHVDSVIRVRLISIIPLIAQIGVRIIKLKKSKKSKSLSYMTQ